MEMLKGLQRDRVTFFSLFDLTAGSMLSRGNECWLALGQRLAT